MAVKRSFEETQRLLKKHLPQLKGGENEVHEDFVRTYGFGNNHVDMFNTLLREGIPNTIKSFNGVVKTITGSLLFYDNIVYERPSYQADNGKKLPLTPRNARDRGLTYDIDIYTDIIEVSPDQKLEISRLKRQWVGKIPIMPKCDLCNLSEVKSKEDLGLFGEDPDDPNGYFIVLGSEKVVLLQEQLIYDKIINHQDDTYFTSRLTYTIPSATRLIEFSLKKADSETRVIKVRLQSLNVKEDNKKTKYHSFNALSLFRLLGMVNSNDILNLIASFIRPEYAYLAKKIFPSIWDLKVVDNDIDMIVKKYQNAQNKKAMEIRSDASRSEFNEEEKLKIIELLMNTDVFQNLNNLPIMQGETETERYDRIRVSKIQSAAIMIARLIELAYGVRKSDDPDSWSNKRLEGPARNCEALFRAAFRKMQYPSFNKTKSAFVSALGNTVTNASELANRFKTTNLIAGSFQDSMNTSNWGVKTSGKFKNNYSQTLQRESIYQTWAHLYTVDVSVSRTNHNFSLRMPHDTAQYFIDSVFTSEGSPCGLLKNLAMGTILSQQRDDFYIMRYLSGEIDGRSRISPLRSPEHTFFFLVNSKPIGWVNQEVYNEIRDLKRNGTIPFDISIYVKSDNTINVETGASRLVRPVLIVDPETQELVLFQKYRPTDKIVFNELLVNGCVEFISPAEQEQFFMKVAEDDVMIQDRIVDIKGAEDSLLAARMAFESGERTAEDVQSFVENLNRVKGKSLPFSHCQIDKTMIMGFVSATIPKPECNQGPRNVYAGQMTKQSTSTPHSNHKSIHSFQSYKTSESAVKPLFMNNALKYLNLEQKGSGHNVNLWMKVTTQTEEDAWKVERDFLLLGGYRGVKWTTMDSLIETKNAHVEKFEKPESYSNAYRYIQPNGMIYIGAPVTQGDVLISKVKTLKSKQIRDPTTMNVAEQGVITGLKYIKSAKGISVSVKIAWVRIQQKGDKNAPRNAQKGTDGLIVPYYLLPYAQDGTGATFTPSAFCLPTRMTMEYIYEILAGNVATTICQPIKATAFDKSENHFKYRKILRDNGKDQWCMVKAYSGTSGRQLQGRIYAGLVHIMALKHQVEDKIQARTTLGPKSEVNAQPTGGRKKNGGLRFGEMEHDAIICHGASACTKNFLMDASDPFTTVYCKCGAYGDYDPTTETFRKCGAHTDVRDFGVYTIPYSYKYLSQVIQPANMKLQPEFITLKEYSERLMLGTLHDNQSFVANVEEEDDELEDFEGNSDIFEEIQGENMDDFEADMGGYEGGYDD